MIDIAERNYSRVFLLATGLLVLLTMLGKAPGQRTALIALVIGVVVLGLPHGALDPMVAKRVLGHERYFSLPLFYAVYTLLALLYALLWWKMPLFGLTTFLVIAAYHFGSDWEARGSALTRICYGLAIVTLPALAHSSEVARIYEALGTSHPEGLIRFSQILAVIGSLVGMLAALNQWRARRSDVLEFIGIVAGGIVLSPLLFFLCYFTLLHSPRHLCETSRFLGISRLRTILVATAPFVLLTLFLGVGGAMFMSTEPLDQRVLRVVFVGLASLTVPHMILEMIAAAMPANHILKYVERKTY